MTWIPLIRFERAGTIAVVRFDTRLDIPQEVTPFQQDRGSEMGAQLLVDHLEELVFSEIEKAIKASYVAGYRDGRGKKLKRSDYPVIDPRIGRFVNG